MHRATALFGSIIFILSTTAGIAQQPGPAPPEKAQAKGGPPATKSASPQEPVPDKTKTKTSTDEEPVITHHRISAGGQELKYTATAALMPIKDSKGETEARIFYIAYTLDDPPAGTLRPVMFSFNGGPGSASIWLHLGALGPRRVPITDEPVIPAPPFRLVDNEETWLDRTDLVFIDPVGTGYSRAAKPELNARFHTLRGDISSVGEFIRMYLTRSDRWGSPLYLIGESYGTTRAAGLAGHLVDHGIAFNGLILVSCALDFRGFMFSDANDAPFRNFLPSYAASAWYHKKLPDDLQARGLAALLREVEEWTDKEYVSILTRGDQLGGEAHRNAVLQLARFTGLRASDIEAANLRITQPYFCKRPARVWKTGGRSAASTRSLQGSRKLTRGRSSPALTREELAGIRRALYVPHSTTTFFEPSYSTGPTLPITSWVKAWVAGTGSSRWVIPQPLASSRTHWPRTRI